MAGRAYKISSRIESEVMKANRNPKTMVRRIRAWMLVSLFGLLLFVVGINPGLFELDRSQVVGFLQIGLWCIGLSRFLLGLYFMVRIYRNGRSKTLLADVGVRLVSTGLVLSITASYADFLGIGSHNRSVLLFGPLQVIGLTLGIVVSLIGLVLYWPWQRKKKPQMEAEPESGPKPKSEISPEQENDD